MSWDIMSDQSQHTQPFFIPSFLFIAFGDSPSNRYSTSSIDDADYQSSKRKSKDGGIQSNSQLLRLPQADYPFDYPFD